MIDTSPFWLKPQSWRTGEARLGRLAEPGNEELGIPLTVNLKVKAGGSHAKALSRA